MMCALEAMSTEYCRGRDAYEMILWKDSHQNKIKYPVTSSAYALRLSDREIPRFLNWLNSIRASGKSQNSYEAARVYDFDLAEGAFRASNDIVRGAIGDFSEAMTSQKTDAGRWQTLKNIMSRLIGKLSGNDSGFSAAVL